MLSPWLPLFSLLFLENNILISSFILSLLLYNFLSSFGSISYSSISVSDDLGLDSRTVSGGLCDSHKYYYSTSHNGIIVLFYVSTINFWIWWLPNIFKKWQTFYFCSLNLSFLYDCTSLFPSISPLFPSIFPSFSLYFPLIYCVFCSFHTSSIFVPIFVSTFPDNF